jgi:hypothetical protein
MSNPADLNTVPQPDTDKNYFNFKATGLKIDTNYAIKFQWVYSDGTVSDWSPGKFVNTNTETVPGAPSATVPTTAIGNIPVTLSAFPANTKRVDIYIIGGVYGSGKVADSFFQSGTKNIPVTAGVYQVSLIAVTPSGINGDPTNTFTITISNVVTEDTTAPDPISAGVVTGGVHPQDSSGQLGYLNIAVTNATIPSDFAGYIVKIVSSTNTWTQTFNSSTALSNLYITGGLFVGQSYTLSVATTDGKNISSYVNCSPSPFTISDTRTNTSTVTGNLSFSATDSILTVSWVASTDSYVDSYRVQVTSNADTTFASPLQTVESKGTTATFGGLTSNTTYRVRVTARYSGAAGALSTNHTTGTFTLNASGAISDGIAPTTNPVITSAMVKSLFGAFAITFPPVSNPDDVKYEVFIKPTNATGIVDNQYKVLEVGGTFAVVKTLADRTTVLSYGTNYYIAVRAKDNDGVSTGEVTAVGPVTTLQVANADLAADSVYANNIKAGEIDATKLTSDVILANQKITVGSNTALDRIRLDATDATIGGSAVSSRIYIGGGNYYDTQSPFYADNLGRLSIGQKLKFESGELTINGKGTFTGTVTAGSGLNSVSIGNDVNSTNDGIYIGATGDYIYTDGTVRLGNGGITYTGGVLTVSGNITANSIAANTSLSGLSITGTTGTIGGITLNSSGLSATNFSISSTGLITANGGTIGGWTINSTQLRSSAADGTGRSYISLNPATPKIALITGATFTNGVPSGGTESITIDPAEGIVGPNKTVGGSTGPAFKFSPNGTAEIRGAIYAESGIFTGNITSTATITGGNLTGSTINLTGVQTGSGSGSSYTESSDTSTRLNFTNARYTIIPANDTWTETVSTPSYDSVNDEWTSTATTSTFTSNTIKFTDSVLEGGIPSSAYYYGETWYEGGTSAGSIINYVNYVGGYLGFEIRANTSEKGFYFIGDSSIAGQNWGVAHLTTSSKDQPAMLQTDQYGKVTRGRAIFTSGSSSTTILGSTWNNVGQNGDLVFSTGN